LRIRSGWGSVRTKISARGKEGCLPGHRRKKTLLLRLLSNLDLYSIDNENYYRIKKKERIKGGEIYGK
ncbi:hypothetical protein, partial [Enterococcus cecorum]|uniref:hypothetical protein n=1 Tax=Enterococcus cecorum TaxID=44008 RepID=UPI001FABEC64